MNSPPHDNWLAELLGSIQADVREIRKRVELQGERLQRVEEQVASHRGGIKWLGALIAGGIGSFVTLIGTWINGK